jgi:hypothetical protein
MLRRSSAAVTAVPAVGVLVIVLAMVCFHAEIG